MDTGFCFIIAFVISLSCGTVPTKPMSILRNFDTTTLNLSYTLRPSDSLDTLLAIILIVVNVLSKFSFILSAFNNA